MRYSHGATALPPPSDSSNSAIAGGRDQGAGKGGLKAKAWAHDASVVVASLSDKKASDRTALILST